MRYRFVDSESYPFRNLEQFCGRVCFPLSTVLPTFDWM